jgi:hypothetical protein
VILIAVVLGAAAIKVKASTIIWRANVDAWTGMQPRWLAWVTLGIVSVAAIIGLMLGFGLNWRTPN